MKSLKYIIASLVLAVGFAAPIANAQDDAPKTKQGQGQRGGDMHAPLLKGITLTPDQQTKVDAIKEEGRKQIQSLPREERRTKGAQIVKQDADKIRAVLTPEQQPTFDANRKAMQERMGNNKGGGKDKAPKPAPAE